MEPDITTRRPTKAAFPAPDWPLPGSPALDTPPAFKTHFSLSASFFLFFFLFFFCVHLFSFLLLFLCWLHLGLYHHASSQLYHSRDRPAFWYDTPHASKLHTAKFIFHIQLPQPTLSLAPCPMPLMATLQPTSRVPKTARQFAVPRPSRATSRRGWTCAVTILCRP